MIVSLLAARVDGRIPWGVRLSGSSGISRSCRIFAFFSALLALAMDFQFSVLAVMVAFAVLDMWLSLRWGNTGRGEWIWEWI